MASCYGDNIGEVVNKNSSFRESCGYLPLTREVTLGNENVEMILDVFEIVNAHDMQQGMMLMNNVIEEGKTWPFDEVFASTDAFFRCAHVCNGGFIANPKYRGLGVGTFMGEAFKRLGKDLGFKSSLFNLVFANNIASVRLWRKLGFTELAIIPQAASLVGSAELVDAYQFHFDFCKDDDGTRAQQTLTL